MKAAHETIYGGEGWAALEWRAPWGRAPASRWAEGSGPARETAGDGSGPRSWVYVLSNPVPALGL